MTINHLCLALTCTWDQSYAGPLFGWWPCRKGVKCISQVLAWRILYAAKRNPIQLMHHSSRFICITLTWIAKCSAFNNNHLSLHLLLLHRYILFGRKSVAAVANRHTLMATMWRIYVRISDAWSTTAGRYLGSRQISPNLDIWSLCPPFAHCCAYRRP